MERRVPAPIKEELRRAGCLGRKVSYESFLGDGECRDFIRAEKKKQHQMKVFERQARKGGHLIIGGIDEAGRGPLAGPVVAACVVFQEIPFLPLVDDSKLLDAGMREMLSECVMIESLDYAVGIVNPEEIDRMNIHNASLEAMRRAMGSLCYNPEFLLVDGLFRIPELDIPQNAIVKGDQRSFVIACASIIAKVTRDRIMCEYDELYPDYGFRRHKGYATKLHLEALQKYGCCPIHRRSFSPVRQAQEGQHREIFEQLSLF